MPHRRQHQGSFREHVDRLVPRLGEPDKKRSKRQDRKDEADLSRSRCQAFHNQALFERSDD